MEPGVSESYHSIETERAIIGTFITFPQRAAEFADAVKAETFYLESHQVIVKAVLELVSENETPDLPVLYERLRSQGHGTLVGEMDGLRQFIEFASPTPSQIESYGKTVTMRWALRQLVGTCQDIVTRSKRVDESNIAEFLAEAEKTFHRLAEGEQKEGLTPASEVVRETVSQLEALFDKPEGITGVPTGYTDLDKITSGFQPSDLIIVAARPAMGKTSLALNFAIHAALKSEKNVAVFSLEMSKVQLMQRMLATQARIKAQRFRDGQLSADELNRLYPEVTQFQSDRLMLDDTPGISMLELASRCRKMEREKGSVDMVIVDYLQLMSGGPGGQNSREREISQISMGLKGLAKELSCPVMALSQLNRGLEQRPDKRPRPSDLRESGSIEQDADQIIFIYRDEVYHTDSPDAGVAEIIFGKNRHGPTETVRLAFQSEFTAFFNLAKTDDSMPGLPPFSR